VIAVPPLLVGAAAAIGPQLLLPQPAVASKLGGAVDSAWEVSGAARTPPRMHWLHAAHPHAAGGAVKPQAASGQRVCIPVRPILVALGLQALGGGPADLYFPEQFLGTWDVVSGPVLRLRHACVGTQQQAQAAVRRAGNGGAATARPPRGVHDAAMAASALAPVAARQRRPWPTGTPERLTQRQPTCFSPARSARSSRSRRRSGRTSCQTLRRCGAPRRPTWASRMATR
jgi:hypothetical protein